MPDMPETLDTLAEKIVALTTVIDKRFDGVDTRFETIDKRFETIDKRFETIDKRFETIDKRFETIDKRFETIEKRFDSVDNRFDSVDKRFDEVKADLRTQIEAVDAKVGLVLEKVTDLIARDARHLAVHVRHEQVLDNHELRLIVLESDKKPSGE